MQDEEASPHPPPERGTTAQWEAKRKESAPTHNSAPPVPCRGQPPTHPPPAIQPPPHPPPMHGVKAQHRRGNCQRHRAMRRGFDCNLILNHIRCRNRIDKHNPKNPKPKPNRNGIQILPTQKRDRLRTSTTNPRRRRTSRSNCRFRRSNRLQRTGKQLVDRSPSRSTGGGAAAADTPPGHRAGRERVAVAAM